jgi:hypothetical protein
MQPFKPENRLAEIRFTAWRNCIAMKSAEIAMQFAM